MDELKLIFASNLIRLRTAAGMTQAELGEQLNYSDKSISKWERGEAIPDAAVLKRMSEIFGVTVDYLLNEHDAWQPGPEPAACDRSHHAIILVALMGIVTLAVLVFVVLWLWLGAVEWIVFACFVPAAVITYLVLNSVFFGGRGNLYVVLGLVASIFVVGYLVLLRFVACAIPALQVCYACIDRNKTDSPPGGQIKGCKGDRQHGRFCTELLLHRRPDQGAFSAA